MDINEVGSKLRTFIRHHYGISEGDHEFNDEVNLFNYGYIDSFGAVELYEFVAKEFSVSITDSHLMSVPLNTIREISTFVVEQQKNREVR